MANPLSAYLFQCLRQHYRDCSGQQDQDGNSSFSECKLVINASALSRIHKSTLKFFSKKGIRIICRHQDRHQQYREVL